MTYLLLVLSIVFTLVMIAQLFRPFFASRGEQLSFEILDEDLRQIEVLVNRKVALVQMLRELEYDWETTKISEDDYQRFKRSCERQAVAIMRRLDAIHGGRDWQEVIDAAINERLGVEASDGDAAKAEAPAAPEASKTEERKTEDSKTEAAESRRCEKCGASLQEDDLFCSKCGTPVSAEPQGEPDSADDEPADEEEAVNQAVPVTIDDGSISSSSPLEVTR